MNYQSGDKLTNRYLSNDAFTSLKNKLGGRSITSLGNNRKRNSYRIPNQGSSLFEYKSLIYKIFISIILIIILLYIIPQTRYFIHGYVSSKVTPPNVLISKNLSSNDVSVYNIAPIFLKTDEFVTKQKENKIPEGTYVYDYFTQGLVGITTENSSSTIGIKLFSDSGFKNNLLIEEKDVIQAPVDASTSTSIDSSMSSSTSISTTSVMSLDSKSKAQTGVKIQNLNKFQSFLFEGLGYGQLVAKIPPKTDIKKDSYLYVKTLDGLEPVAQIVSVDEDNSSTFTIVYAQLITSPANLYKVILK
jgi:hypothetical protein